MRRNIIAVRSMRTEVVNNLAAKRSTGDVLLEYVLLAEFIAHTVTGKSSAKSVTTVEDSRRILTITHSTHTLQVGIGLDLTPKEARISKQSRGMVDQEPTDFLLANSHMHENVPIKSGHIFSMFKMVPLA